MFDSLNKHADESNYKLQYRPSSSALPSPKFVIQWDVGNLEKLEKVRASRRHFTVDDLESVFGDPNQLLETSYPDEKTGEERCRIISQSNQN